MLEAILEFLWLSPMPLWGESIVRVVAWGLIVSVVAVVLWSLIKYLCNTIRVLLGRKDSSPQQRSLFSCFILMALLMTFGGFTYMHYHTVGFSPPAVKVQIDTNNDKVTGLEASTLFERRASDNDRATNRVFALVTVLIATATLIVALQFILNSRMMKELELRGNKLKEDLEKIEKDFMDKHSKLSQINEAINKIESFAQATSYPLHISMNIIDKSQADFFGLDTYGVWIKNSFKNFSPDNLKDKADWNSVLFMARQAMASKDEQADDAIKRLVAVAACKSEECTGDREEKSILLSLAIDTFEMMNNQNPEDEVNLASAYARRGMLYACLPRNNDYKKADSIFEKVMSASLNDNELNQKAFYNRGLSWLFRASIFARNIEEWGQDSFREARSFAEEYLGKTAPKSDYALLTLYSISKEKEKCKDMIISLEDRFQKNSESLPLPRLHRIKEDIDLKFIKDVDEELYLRLVTLTAKNDAKEKLENKSS